MIIDNIYIDPPSSFYDIKHWTVSGDFRAPNTGIEDDANYRIRDDLEEIFSDVDFDPESSCFYAYTQTEERAEELFKAIENWLTQRVHNFSE